MNSDATKEAAKQRMEDIFHSHLKPTETERNELINVYQLRGEQITKWFGYKRRNYKRSIDNRKRKSEASPPYPPPYPFSTGFKCKGTNLEPSKQQKTQNTRQSSGNYNTQRCKCESMCVASYDDLISEDHASVSICKQAKRNVEGGNMVCVEECTYKNCPNIFDCGNKYSNNKLWHIGKTVVAVESFKGGVNMKGLKVQTGMTIPCWGVIGEYTGTKLTKRGDSDSAYIIQVSKKMWIDAENEGNTMRYINHRCDHPNAAFIKVTNEGRETVFVKAIKEIRSDEFISINYGRTYKMIDKCLCVDCENKCKDKTN